MLWRYIYICIDIYIYLYIYIVIPRGSRAPITAAPMRKIQYWRFFIVIELREDIRICKDQSLQHFDRCLLKLGNEELKIAELPDSINISPEYLCEIRDDSGIAIRESIRHFVEKIFSDINGTFYAPEEQWIFG